MTDYIAQYQTYLTEEKHASANTLSSYIRDLNQFQAWLMQQGAMDLRKVKKETVSAYLQHLTDLGKSPATVTRGMASLKSFYAYMVQAGQEYGANWYCAGAVTKKGHPHHPLYLRKDEKIKPFDVEGYLACR